MFGAHDLALFVISGLLLNISPGADKLFIVTRSSTLGLPVSSRHLGSGVVAAYTYCQRPWVYRQY